MNDTPQEDQVPAGGPLFFTVPAYGFVMALYLDCLVRRPTLKVFPPTLCGTHKEKQSRLLSPSRGPSNLGQRVWTLVGPGMLRRSKIFIVKGLKHAISSVGAASNRGHAAR